MSGSVSVSARSTVITWAALGHNQRQIQCNAGREVSLLVKHWSVEDVASLRTLVSLAA